MRTQRRLVAGGWDAQGVTTSCEFLFTAIVSNHASKGILGFFTVGRLGTPKGDTEKKFLVPTCRSRSIVLPPTSVEHLWNSMPRAGSTKRARRYIRLLWHFCGTDAPCSSCPSLYGHVVLSVVGQAGVMGRVHEGPEVPPGQ